jgi:NAD(P)-dependent dehydrogenase (short-subunit alcohol dehydrogenase family)
MQQVPQVLAGRVAVVTGINGLLGPVWAGALLDAGAVVWGLDLKVDAPNAAVVQLLAVHANRLGLLAANVTDRTSLEQARTQIAAKGAAPSLLINNAGIDQPPRPGAGWRVDEFPWDDFKRVVDVNLGGAFLASQVFGAAMVAARHGSIINIGSLYASVSPDARNYDHLPSNPPFLKPPAYGASKAGLHNLTQYLATHWGPQGVRVNMLSPGGVEGGQDVEFKRKFCSRVPLGRMARHADLVGPVIFLASDASLYVTGQNLQVDGGYTLW